MKRPAPNSAGPKPRGPPGESRERAARGLSGQRRHRAGQVPRASGRATPVRSDSDRAPDRQSRGDGRSSAPESPRRPRGWRRRRPGADAPPLHELRPRHSADRSRDGGRPRRNARIPQDGEIPARRHGQGPSERSPRERFDRNQDEASFPSLLQAGAGAPARRDEDGSRGGSQRQRRAGRPVAISQGRRPEVRTSAGEKVRLDRIAPSRSRAAPRSAARRGREARGFIAASRETIKKKERAPSRSSRIPPPRSPDRGFVSARPFAARPGERPAVIT